ncbi:MAG TPA: hypothetical protein PLV92_06135, partial [Pirellulaceae bacterium]|nr:hypothetical protein [Pirellulaceae bacterium]
QGPTLRGLLRYLNSNWFPTITSNPTDGIELELTSRGIALGVSITPQITKTANLHFGDEFESFGLKFDSSAALNINVTGAIDIDMGIDWIDSKVKFDVNTLSLKASASIDDLLLAATVGPLEVSVGKAGAQYGQMSFDLGGKVSFVDNVFSFTPAANSFSAYFPVYASLAGFDFASGDVPHITLNGSIFGNSSGFNFTAQGFEKLLDFRGLTVAQVIQMFPDFREYLQNEVTTSSSLLTQIPFATTAINQVLLFADAFDAEVYSKINFMLPRVDRAAGVSGSLAKGSKSFTDPSAHFTDDLVGQYVSFVDGTTIIATYAITDVPNATTLTLQSSGKATLTNHAYVVHQKLEKLKTLQQLTSAVNASGVLPAGVQVSFDPVSKVFSVPLSFAKSFSPVDTPLDFGFDFGDAFSLTTTAHGAIQANVSGGLSLFVDLDGRTYDGTNGSVAVGSDLFQSPAFTFTEAMVGYDLKVGDATYSIKSLVDAHSVRLTRTATTAATNSSFRAIEGLTLGISNAVLGGTVALDVNDLTIAAQLGFLGLTAGGAGTGSGVHVAAAANVVLDRDVTTNNPADTRFSFDDIFSGEATRNLHLDFTGDAYARLRGLRVNAGLGGDLNIAPTAEVGVYVQNLLDIDSVKTLKVDPSLTFDLSSARADGLVGPNDLVVTLPDLSRVFDFSQITFEDIIAGIRTGLDFLQDSLQDEPFYNTALPVINQSLADVFQFADDFASQLDDAEAATPSGANAQLQKFETIIEKALHINDDNTLDPQDQKFSLKLHGKSLDVHVKFDAVFSDFYSFSINLGTLIPGIDSIGELADLLGAGGNIRLDAFVNLNVDFAIDFSDALGGGVQIYLYDYRPTREQTVISDGSLFSSAAFAAGSSTVTEAMFSSIKAQFAAAIAAASVGLPAGTTAKELRAEVVSAIDMSLGSSANTDSTYGAGQLLGRRQKALGALESRLSQELGVDVTLLAAEQVRAADSAAANAVRAFKNVKVTLAVPVSADLATGTHLSLGGRILGQNLELGLEAGPIKIGVNGGYAVLDGDGNPATNDYAAFTVALDQPAGTPNDDGKFYPGTESFADNIRFVLQGGMDVNLPVKLDVSGIDFALETPLRVRTNPALGDQGLRALLEQLTSAPRTGGGSSSGGSSSGGSSGGGSSSGGGASSGGGSSSGGGTSSGGGSSNGSSAISFSLPDFKAEFARLGGSFSVLGILNDPSMLIDGVDTALGAVQDVFDSSVTQDIPLIGDKLRSAAHFLGDLRTGILADLREKLSGNGKLVELTRGALFDVFGPSGLGILRDNTNDGSITVADVLVGWYDKSGVFIQQWVKGMSPPAGTDAIQFNVGLGGVLFGDGISIPLDINLPGFALNVNGGFAIELGWQYDFGFGLSVTDGFYLTTNQDATPEFHFDVKVFLDGQPENPSIVTPFSGEGKLVFFKVSLVDQDSKPNVPGFQPSGLYGGLTLDYTGNERGRLTMNHVMSTPISKLFSINFGVDASLNLGATLEVEGANALPKLRGDLMMDFSWDLKRGATP